MNIFMTGATGLVGRQVLETLLSHIDTQIFATTRTSQSFVHKNLKWIDVDLLMDHIDLAKLLKNIDIVVHVAAHISDGFENVDLNSSIKLNIVFTTRLFESAIKNNVRQIIYISTFSFLQKPLESTITEDHPVQPLSPYSIGKYWGEMLLFRQLRLESTKAVALRIPSPIGQKFESQHKTVLKHWVENALAGRNLVVYGNGERTQDYISTVDIAYAVELALNTQAEGIFNIATGSPISNLELATMIAKWKDVGVEFSGIDTLSQDRWNISIDKATQILGFRPRYSSKEAVEHLLRGI